MKVVSTKLGTITVVASSEVSSYNFPLVILIL